MKATAILIPLPSVLFSLSLACSTVSNVKITFYGWPDNSPPGAGTAYNCDGRNNIAGGSGTYNDPLTFASDPSEYSPCELIYLPYLKKYLRMEDECAECETDWSNGVAHIDIWTGSSTSGGGNDQIQCEDDLTPNPKQQVIRSPAEGYDVDSTALYDDGTCNTQDTYDGNTIGC